MDESHSRKKSKEKYRKTIRTVYHQTSNAQPPLIDIEHVILTAASPDGMDGNEVRNKIKIGVEEKKHLICIDGKFGVRFDEDRLQRIITYVAENNIGEVNDSDGNTKNKLIAELNKIKMNVSGVDFKHLKYKTE